MKSINEIHVLSVDSYTDACRDGVRRSVVSEQSESSQFMCELICHLRIYWLNIVHTCDQMNACHVLSFCGIVVYFSKIITKQHFNSLQ